MPVQQRPVDLSPARFDDGGAVLVLGSTEGGITGVCSRLLAPDGRGGGDVLRITYSDPWDALELDSSTDHAHEHVGLVAIGQAAVRIGSMPGRDRITVERIVEPADLTEVGITISELLSNWADNGNRTVACFDSITDLLGHVSIETAFEFLHVLTRRLDAFGATAHYHLAPAAHNDRTVERLKPLFDAIVTVDDGIEVRTR